MNPKPLDHDLYFAPFLRVHSHFLGVVPRGSAFPLPGQRMATFTVVAVNPHGDPQAVTLLSLS